MSGGSVRRRLVAATLTLIALWPCASAGASGPPQIEASWVTEVSATGATARGEINPNGLSTTYRVQYLTAAAYAANLSATPPRDAFAGAQLAPTGGPAGVGAGSTPVPVVLHLSGLAPGTAYRYRHVATNSAGTSYGPAHPLTTQASSISFALPDGRGWEMVSPIDKNGGSISGPGSVFGGGVFQAAIGGSGFTYSAAPSFATPQGAPAASQYLASRSGSGWTTANLTTPSLSGSYGDHPEGAPYKLFSPGLSRAVLLNGERCRGSEGECPVANPPLPGSDAPAGYQNYYLRSGGDFKALVDAAALSHSTLSNSRFTVSLAGANTDLSAIVLSSCAALSGEAIEVPGPEGCEEEEQNLYEADGEGLDLVNLKPAGSKGSPGAALAAPIGAVSQSGSRVYWTLAGDLYLRDGAVGKQVDESLGGGGTFETASADGAVAFLTKAGHLYRYLAAPQSLDDLAPGGGVVGVLGAAADGSVVYYATAAGIFRWSSGDTVEIAAGVEAAAASDYPPATGTARVTPDGDHLAFLSSAPLTDYDNAGRTEVYLYGPQGGDPPRLICASCNPSGERPRGDATIPGAYANGDRPLAFAGYKPRVLSSDGSRLFFDSDDAPAVADTNAKADVYEYEARGAGGCERSGGCLDLVSSGRGTGGATFLDASDNGDDVFFLTDASLVSNDPGSFDVYDARVNGGFPPPAIPFPCVGDACQPLPNPPVDPVPGTLAGNSGNPPLRFPKQRPDRHRKKKHQKHHKKHHSHHRGGRR